MSETSPDTTTHWLACCTVSVMRIRVYTETRKEWNWVLLGLDESFGSRDMEQRAVCHQLPLLRCRGESYLSLRPAWGLIQQRWWEKPNKSRRVGQGRVCGVCALPTNGPPCQAGDQLYRLIITTALPAELWIWKTLLSPGLSNCRAGFSISNVGFGT